MAVSDNLFETIDSLIVRVKQATQVVGLNYENNLPHLGPSSEGRAKNVDAVKSLCCDLLPRLGPFIDLETAPVTIREAACAVTYHAIIESMHRMRHIYLNPLEGDDRQAISSMYLQLKDMIFNSGMLNRAYHFDHKRAPEYLNYSAVELVYLSQLVERETIPTKENYEELMQEFRPSRSNQPFTTSNRRNRRKHEMNKA